MNFKNFLAFAAVLSVLVLSSCHKQGCPGKITQKEIQSETACVAV